MARNQTDIMKFVALILARGGSKGVPRKNVKLLNGKPLLSYVIEEAKISEYIDDIYVSTDDFETKYIAENLGVKVIDRPPELATDDSPSIESVKHFLKQVDTDYVVLLNACCPLTTVEDIDGAIEMVMETEADSVVSLVEDFSSHPTKICYLNENKVEHPLIENFFGYEEFMTVNRQHLQKTFKRNTAIYISKKEVIESGTFFGKDTRGYVMSKENSLDINDQFDFDIAEFLINKRVE